MIDYHTHSKYSDGVNSYREIVSAAKKSGLSEIGLSDHFCLHYPKWAVKKSDFSRLTEEIQLLKIEYKDQIKIKFGFETDYIEDRENEIADFLHQFPLDYVIGSVHYVNNWNFDTDKKSFSIIDVDRFYIEYFSLIQKAAQSGLFHIIGHIDLAKKFNYYPSFNLTDIYHHTAKILKDADVAYELNTSGMDKDCKYFYPSDQFLKILFQHQVPVTLGSDTHKIADLTRYFDIALQKLKTIGYNKLAVFKNRERDFIPI